MKNISMNLKLMIKNFIAPRADKHISSNFKIISSSEMEKISQSLTKHYFRRSIWEGAITAEEYLTLPEGQRDMSNHLTGRLNEFRNITIPWLDDSKSLRGASILEIGCGTGSSTVALAEQGAKVTAVDIDEDSLKVAQDRCDIYGLDVTFLKANGAELKHLLKGQHFDFIIFFACLEHMTNEERILSLKDTWEMLSKGSVWCVIETPNRLWYFDDHTSQLPFYSWLPDDLAFTYSQFSRREPFSKAYRQHSPEGMLSFLRHGRGVSFHEFDLSMKKAQELNVISSLSDYLQKKNFLRKLNWHLKVDSRYENFLAAQGPSIHRGFYQPSLDLIIQK